MLSHPTWVRGLKLIRIHKNMIPHAVAPYVGAWIETTLSASLRSSAQSRTLRGCVD